MNNSNNTFSINSTHQSFTDKQKSLFAELENVEKNNKQQTWQPDKYYEDAMDVQPPVQTERNTVIRERKECRPNRSSRTRQYKCKESIFKRPQAPISKCLPIGKTPGYRKNPNKWTEYSLEDVKDEDMTDRSNTHAALSFLKELEKDNRAGSSDEERLESLPEKIVFKKSSMVKKTNESLASDAPETSTMQEEKPSFRSSKVVMPEYVVGQVVKKDKKKKVKRNVGEASNSNRQLKLDHLDDLDNEDEYV